MPTGAGLPLVGRDAALKEVEACLADARASRGGLLLLTGEAGIGKTRLAEEAAARAEGFTIAWVWCGLDAAAPPFRAWTRLVRALTAADGRLQQVVRQRPSLRALLSGEVPNASVDPPAGRALLFDDIADFIGEAAAGKPILAVFDDVHETQESSLQLLAYLAAASRSTPVLLVGTAREGEQVWQGHVAARAAVLRQARVVHLDPLPRAAVSALLAHLAETPLPADVEESVVERTGGNPLLVIELGKQVARGDREVAPESVMAMVSERMVGLGAQARAALAAAAVLGSRFRPDVLASVAGLDEPRINGLLGVMEARGLVISTGPASWSFVHDLLQEAVYGLLPASERLVLHQRAGEALLELAKRGGGLGVGAAAYQLLRAGPDSAAQAAELAWQAGDRALNALAYEDAARWYEQAGLALDVAGAAAGRRAALLLALGEARLGSGDRLGARAEFLQAATLARDAGQPQLLASAALGLGSGAPGFEVGLFDREQIDLLEEARAALTPVEPALLALVTARLSVATTMMEGEDRRLQLAQEAVEWARASGDARALVSALSALCDAQAGPDYCAARRAHADEVIAAARRVRDRSLELLGRRQRLVALVEAGAFFEADAEITAFAACAQALRHPLYGWYVPLWRGMQALLAGRFDECRSRCEEVERLGRMAGSDNAMLLAATQRWCLAGAIGDAPELEELNRELERIDLPSPWVGMARALGAAQLGRLEEARGHLDAVGPQLPSLARDSEWLPALGQVAETVALTGAHPCAAWVYDALLPYGALFAVEGIGAAIRGPVHWHLGLLAEALGRPREAAQHVEAAVAACRAAGAAELARRIGGTVPATGRQDAVEAPNGNAFRRDGELWTVSFGGREVRLPDSKGLRDLAKLLAQPGGAMAALDLATSIGGGRSPEPGLAAPGDLGQTLDAQARQDYRERLLELETEADDADARGDVERSATIAAEREALVEQLTLAYGLGGRARRTGSAAERARTTVTARIREAIRRVARAHPDLGRHLDRSVRTGTFCSYEPESPLTWQV